MPLTPSEYQDYRRQLGLPVPSYRTIMRQITAHKLWAEKDTGGGWLIDPMRQPVHNAHDTHSNDGTKVGRKRTAKNRGLPDNLHPNDKNGVTYYRYRVPAHITVPDENRWIPLGSDKAKATDAARQLNQHYGLGADLVQQALSRIETARTGGTDKDISRYIDHFLAKILPTRRVGERKEPMAPDTLYEYGRVANEWKKEWPGHTFDTLSQAHIATYLNKQSSDEVHNKKRSQLVVFYRHAISDGLAKTNWPEKILPKDGIPTVRHRLKIEWYQAAFQHASPQGQAAMEIALNLLWRNKDIRTALNSDRRKDGNWYKVLSKTKAHGKDSYLCIPGALPLIHSELGCTTLDDLIKTCRALSASTNHTGTGIASPCIIWQVPKRKQKSKEKAHWTALSKKDMSASFTDALIASGACDHLTPAERPTLHECIALGEHLYEKAGYSLDWIRTLRGHKNTKTTKIYLEGHEWTTIPMPK